MPRLITLDALFVVLAAAAVASAVLAEVLEAMAAAQAQAQQARGVLLGPGSLDEAPSASLWQ